MRLLADVVLSLIACVCIGAHLKPRSIVWPFVFGAGIALFLHAWLPLLIGISIACVLAGLVGHGWIKNGDH